MAEAAAAGDGGGEAPAFARARGGVRAALRQPGFVITRAARVASRVPVALPDDGLQFFVRRGTGHGLIDEDDGLPSLRFRRSRAIEVIVYAAWLDGDSVPKIAAEFGWSVPIVREALDRARRRSTTLKAVHDAIGKLDRVGVPEAVDTLLHHIVEKKDLTAALKLLEGRQALVRANAAGDVPKGGNDVGSGANSGFGITVNIVGGDRVSMLGTVVGKPMPVVDAEPVDG